MISQHAMQSIGWALIYSLWQGLAIYLLTKVAFKVVGKADARYGLGVLAMLLIVTSFAVTFLVLNKETTSAPFELIINIAPAAAGQPTSFLQAILQFIDQNMIWLLRFWILGFAAGLVRIAGGLWYINRLRRNSSPVQDEFNKLLHDLTSTLKITKAVAIAEAAIASPMVVGFMKPMILFPVGLLAGLSTEQVEAILVHELSHIRRQDYIINLVQSVIETIFFFNPFALLISSLIREERENCCDDLVIAEGISPISYAKTLAQLEAARQPADAARSSSNLALGIAGNQNQLLNRIKRIMENSAKNDWGKGRLIPVALLFLGLICASWLSIGSEKKEQDVALTQAGINKVVLVSDTSKKDGLKVLKKRDNGVVLVEPAEPAELPEMFELPAIPEFDEMLQFPPVPDFNFDEMADITFDSIPGYRFHIRDGEDWEVFEQEFTEKFKERFKDFYNKNQKKFDKMFDEMNKSHVTRDEARVRREAAEVVELDKILLQKGNEMRARQSMASADMLIELEAMSEKAMAEHARAYAELDRMTANQNLNILNDQLQRSSEIYEDMARNYDAFAKVLTEQLIADGYLKSGEKIDQLQMNDNNGKMTINGKSIKEKDRIKYKALQDKYFNTRRIQIIPGRSE